MLLIAGCEKEQIVNADEGTQQLTVVQAEIHPNSNFPGVRITRTLPVQVPWTIKAAEITDAIAYLRIDGVKIVPLHYDGEGMYRPLYDFVVAEGSVYELFGKASGQTFHSLTHIPYVPIILASHYNPNDSYADAVIRSRAHEVYSALWQVGGEAGPKATEFFALTIPTDSLVTSTVMVRSAAFPTAYQGDEYHNARYIQVYAFDESYEKYFKTKAWSQQVGSPYTSGSGKTEWNVSGENVIGLFIGTAGSAVTYVP